MLKLYKYFKYIITILQFYDMPVKLNYHIHSQTHGNKMTSILRQNLL